MIIGGIRFVETADNKLTVKISSLLYGCFEYFGLCLFLSVLTERRMVFPCRQITESVQIASLSCNDFLRKRSNHNAGDHICNCIACVYRCTYRNISCPMKKYFVCCGGYHLVLYFNLDVLR